MFFNRLAASTPSHPKIMTFLKTNDYRKKKRVGDVRGVAGAPQCHVLFGIFKMYLLFLSNSLLGRSSRFENHCVNFQLKFYNFLPSQ